MSENRFVRCGTVQYFNDQGLTDPSLNGIGMVNCSEIAAPFNTSCSTGAAIWMATVAQAAPSWRQKWPEITQIAYDSPGSPAHNVIANNTYCLNTTGPVHEFISSNVDPSCPNFGAGCAKVLNTWKVMVYNNTETHDCV
eukprot:SAG31_NODE_1203_length_9413_cov_4.778076_3_plen_139_part_00